MLSGNGRMNISLISGKCYLFIHQGAQLKTQEVSISFSDLFLKKESSGFIVVCHIWGYRGTKVVKSTCRMLHLYMRFNGIVI